MEMAVEPLPLDSVECRCDDLMVTVRRILEMVPEVEVGAFEKFVMLAAAVAAAAVDGADCNFVGKNLGS